MADLYGRQFELFVGNPDVPLISATNGIQFKTVFNVQVDAGGFNSFAEISVYNLSRSTENKVFKRGQYVALRAGSQNNIDMIFEGEIQNILRFKEGANTKTTIYAKSGMVVQSTKTISQSFASGVTIATLIQSCASALELPLVMNADDFSDAPYLSGYNMTGDPKNYLNRLASSHGFKWVTELGKIVVTKNGSFRQGEVFEVSTETGMEGVPVVTENGVDVSMRMNPHIRIGHKFQLKSSFAVANYSSIYFVAVPETVGTGEYKVERMEYDGDSHGDKWTLKIIGRGQINLGEL